MTVIERQLGLAGVLTHAELVHRARMWLLGAGGCVAAVSERGGSDGQIGTEIADAIGWTWHARSTLIEVKMTHADFLADATKPHRSGDGLGTLRYYMSPKGVISPNEIPESWGLLYATAHRVAIIKNAEAQPVSARRELREKQMMVDLLRRVYLRGYGHVITDTWDEWMDRRRQEWRAR